MNRIYSKVSNELIHFNFSARELLVSGKSKRADLVDAENFLQISVLSLHSGDAFPAHVHIERKSKLQLLKAQESWVVLDGSVRVDYYDIDDCLLDSKVLNSGSVSVTLHGGHAYTSLVEGTIVLEYKSGPYEGKDKDKRMIAARSE